MGSDIQPQEVTPRKIEENRSRPNPSMEKDVRSRISQHRQELSTLYYFEALLSAHLRQSRWVSKLSLLPHPKANYQSTLKTVDTKVKVLKKILTDYRVVEDKHQYYEHGSEETLSQSMKILPYVLKGINEGYQTYKHQNPNTKSYSSYQSCLEMISVGAVAYLNSKFAQFDKQVKMDKEFLVCHESKFHEIKRITIEVMKLFITDLLAMVNVCRNVSYQLQHMVYVGAMVDKQHKSELLEVSRGFDPEQMGMGIEFFEDVSKTVEEIASLKIYSFHDASWGLRKIKEEVSRLEEKWDLYNRFSHFGDKVMRNWSMVESVMANYEKHSAVFHQAIELAQTIIKHRDEALATLKIDPSKKLTPQEKKMVQSLDRMALASNQNHYKVLFGPIFHDSFKFQMDSVDKIKSASFIAMFVDVFYADASHGQTLHGKDLQSHRNGFSQGELREIIAHKTAEEGVIPVFVNVADVKEKFENEILCAAGKLEKSLLKKDRSILLRYMRVFTKKGGLIIEDENKEQKTVTSLKYDVLGYAEGVLVKVNEKIFEVERVIGSKQMKVIQKL